MLKKIRIYTLFFLALFSTLTIVNAVEEDSPKPEVETGKASLTIDFKTTDNSTALSGAVFKVYKVASINERNHLVKDQEYESVDADFEKTTTEEEWQKLVESFIKAIEEQEKEIKETATCTTDTNGICKMENLEEGLYLVVGAEHTQGNTKYTPAPFFVRLPEAKLDDDDESKDEWNYDVRVEPKYTSETNPDEPHEGGGKTSIKVIKIWEDEGNEKKRPGNVQVELYQDGKVIDKVKLSEDNNWTYTWTGLDNSYNYRVEESLNKKYDRRVTQEGNTFIIVNTYKEDDFILPDTGQLWWPVPLLIGGGLILIAVGIMVNRKKEDTPKEGLVEEVQKEEPEKANKPKKNKKEAKDHNEK